MTLVGCVLSQAFMERLGLWGDGAMFGSFDVFLDTVQKKGLGTSTPRYESLDTLMLSLTIHCSFIT